MKKNDRSTHNNTPTKPHPFWRVFWLTFLVMSLAYAWYSFYAPSNAIKWEHTNNSPQNLANDAGKNTLLFFTGKWCSPCQIMKREVFADTEVMKIINSQVIPIQIDIDNPDTKAFVTHYKIEATPTTMVIDSKGKVLDVAVGKIEKKKFLKMITQVESKQ